MQLDGGLTNVAERIVLNGAGISSTGAVRSISGNNFISGAITTSSTGGSITADADTLTLSGGISGSGGFSFGGAGEITITTNGITMPSGFSADVTRFGTGVLNLNASNSFSNLYLNGGTVVVGNAGALDAVTPVFVSTTFGSSSSTLRLNGFSVNIAGLLSTTSVKTVENLGATAATLTIDTAFNQSFQGTVRDGVASAALSVIKTGTGSQGLGGTNTYTGTTMVTNGTLVVSGTHMGGGAYTVGASGTLAGGGVVTLATGASITISGTISPGTVGPDTLTLTTSGSGATVLPQGGMYLFETNRRADQGSEGTNWDKLALAALTVSADATHLFIVKVIGLTNANAQGSVQSWDPDVGQTWRIATVSGTVSGFDPDAFEVDYAAFTANNPIKANFYVWRSGGDILLTYVPEPTAGMMMLLGLPMLLHRRQRCK